MDVELNHFLTQKFGEFLSEERKGFIESVLENRTEFMRVVLEDIRDPHNANAIIRSGECLGIQHYHIIENENAFKLGRGVSRGAIKWVDVHQYPESKTPTKDVLSDLKSKGYKIVVTSPNGNACSPEDLHLTQPFAVVMGNERDGVSEESKAMADDFVRLPMHGFTESYNVSVASGIIFYSLISKIRSLVENWQFDDQTKADYRLQWYKKCMARPDDYERFFVKAFEPDKL
ncbi:RNA methyltransferase [Marivirga harenae]|uniref:TrmH family RNA methyltransferase n=1 Tax=Marivirga harenae TaxID=2010992 RepID=UPI0026DF463D|nr:RNA methyltransferase [Marivirga harenae]WKV11540.1 RNA methyltransferase [Marivirga harenae]|tara:strand:- start:23445 stop:24137 length:693 start_codon:yes stop_codon:yes gene_type:complete